MSVLRSPFFPISKVKLTSSLSIVATDQEPPKEGEEGYESYFKAYQAFIIASQRSMRVPRLAAAEMASKSNFPLTRPVSTCSPLSVNRARYSSQWKVSDLYETT